MTSSVNMYELVLAKLDKLAATSGKAKEPLILAFLEDPYFVSVCKMALDPYRTFGVRDFNIAQGERVESGPSLEEFEYKMSLFESRELSGHAAKRTLGALWDQGVPRELLLRVIRKDLRAGFGADTINKVQKGFVKVFKVALAEEYSADAVQFPILVSPKFDGLRCIVMVAGENVQFLSRNGLPFPALQCHEEKWLSLDVTDMVFDCEVIDGNFFTSLGVKKKKGDAKTAQFQVFDMLPLADFMSRVTTTPQIERLDALQTLLGKRPLTDTLQYCPHQHLGTNELVMAAYDEYRALGLEGAIMKDPKAPYQFRRSKAWTKLKDVKSFDLPLLDVIEGKGRLEGTMGALVVKINERDDRVGTGFEDSQRAFFWEKRFEIRSAADSGHPWIIEVDCHELTPDGSMRHSRFKRIRIDKVKEDGQGV